MGYTDGKANRIHDFIQSKSTAKFLNDRYHIFSLAQNPSYTIIISWHFETATAEETVGSQLGNHKQRLLVGRQNKQCRGTEKPGESIDDKDGPKSTKRRIKTCEKCRDCAGFR